LGWDIRIEEILKMKVIKRNTVQRHMILNAMIELDGHVTAEQVYDFVSKAHPSISKATVYRNLSQMAESGEIVNIGNFHGSALYDYHSYDHYHFVCQQCKQVFDIMGEFSDIHDRVEHGGEFCITDHNLYFSGLCRKCSDANELAEAQKNTG
jgi:Fe2+ or Zn2+ uptake regulation protein